MKSPVPFDRLCELAGIPKPRAELRFAPPRLWRFDWAWVDQKLALEVQGGLFLGGRHVRGSALLKEHEKLNAAAALGWRVTYCTPKQIANGDALTIVQKALAAR